MSKRKDTSTTVHWMHLNRLYLDEFAKETDRAGVIISASMLDQVLETVLRSYLSPTSSSDDELFDSPNAPLSTFSSRINMCHRLGLISPRLCRDLHIIRRIRNQFAHNITGCTFEAPGVRNRILELTRSTGVCDNIPRLRQAIPEGPKSEFQLSVSMILTYLWMQAEQISQLSSQGDEYIYNKDFWDSVMADIGTEENEQENSGDKE